MGDTAEGLLREMVEDDPIDGDSFNCIFCGASFLANSFNPPEHFDDCIYIRAKKLLEQYDKWDKEVDDDINDLLDTKAKEGGEK